MRRLLSAVSVLIIGISVLFVTAGALQARNVSDVFSGSIVILGKRAPTNFRSSSDFVRFLRSNRLQHIWPQKSNKDEWRVEYMAFFPRPLDDLEVTIKFYDVTQGRKKFVTADTVYTPAKGERILSSTLVLDKNQFGPNQKYAMLVLNARRQVLAQTAFWLRGETERYSGRVTFTEDEARGGDLK